MDGSEANNRKRSSRLNDSGVRIPLKHSILEESGEMSFEGENQNQIEMTRQANNIFESPQKLPTIQG